MRIFAFCSAVFGAKFLTGTKRKACLCWKSCWTVLTNFQLYLKRPSVVVFPICYSFVFHGLSSQARFGGLRENKKSTLWSDTENCSLICRWLGTNSLISYHLPNFLMTSFKFLNLSALIQRWFSTIFLQLWFVQLSYKDFCFLYSISV